MHPVLEAYEVENYFISPSLRLAYVAKMNLELGLFPVNNEQAEADVT